MIRSVEAKMTKKGKPFGVLVVEAGLNAYDIQGPMAVIEAARLLSQHEFEATILYVCFGGEEQGLVGSKAWLDEVVVAWVLKKVKRTVV